MFLRTKKKASCILASVLVLFMTANLNVYANEETNNNNNISDNSAYLEYDVSIGNYRLLDDNGEEIEVYTEETTNSSESEVTEPAVTTQVTTTAPVITGVIYFTTVSTKQTSPAQTVPEYSGRQRSDALSERQSYMNSYTTTTTTKKVTTTKKTTTTTTGTKAVYKGIDVSRYQGNIDWKKVKAAGIEFVMIRAGYGMESGQVDAKFHENIKAAQSVGIDCGVYWYSYALNTNDALKEAKLCYNTIKGYKLTYPVSFDIEDPSQSNLTMTEISNITKTFCNYLQEQKYYVSVYSFASMLTNKMNASVLSSYDIWVAHTGVGKPNFDGKYGMWQYSWKGSVSGITGDVDLDYSYKYYPAIMKNKKLNGF